MFLQKSDYNKRKNRSGGIIMAILVTGGAGYIGSHTVVELQNAGYDVVVLDNLSNASEKALDRVSKITGKPVKFYKADILDRDALNDIFDKETIKSCIHFATKDGVITSAMINGILIAQENTGNRSSFFNTYIM